MDNFLSEHLCVYAIPAGTPNRTGIFSVTVNGHPLGLLSERNAWEKPCTFGVFDIDEGFTAEVRITVDKPFVHAALYPDAVTLRRDGNTLVYTIDHPVNALSLVLDHDFQGETLHLFSNAIDHHAPTESSASLLYVPPGYYNLSAFGARKPDIPCAENGTLPLSSGQTLYLAGGAVIDGTVSISDAEHVCIRGSGILMKSEDCAVQTPKAQGICLLTAHAEHISIENIVCHAHRWHNWTVHLWHSSDISVSGIKIFSPVYASTDGIDISNSSHITVKNTFIRACDDSIAIKGLAGADQKPCDCPPIEDILFEHCVLWNDCNNCMGIGAETRAKYFKNITFHDIDVIYSFDDRDHHEQLDERSVMTICSLHGTYFENIVWDTVRVTACQRLICLTFRNDFWFGTLPGDQSTPGGMHNITCRNITVEQDTCSSISGEILLDGMENKEITDVLLDTLTFCGTPVIDANRIHSNPHVKNITIHHCCTHD